MNTVTDHSTAEVLSKALAALRVRGWTKFTTEEADGRLDVTGALTFAIAGTAHHPRLTPDDRALLWSAERALWEVGVDPSVIIWNDEPDRTFGDVERALTAAIAWAGGVPAAGEPNLHTDMHPQPGDEASAPIPPGVDGRSLGGRSTHPMNPGPGGADPASAVRPGRTPQDRP